MELTQIQILFAALGLSVIITSFMIARYLSIKARNLDLSSEASSQITQAALALDEARQREAASIERETGYRTRLDLAIETAENQKLAMHDQQTRIDNLQSVKSAAEQNVALRDQEIVAMQKRMEDWETVKKESMDVAKAASMSAMTEMSNKLLEDHKRETTEAHKKSETMVQKTTQELSEHFKGITESVATLNDRVAQQTETVDTVWQALSNPGGAGYFAEIGLEGTLTDFGLKNGRDFSMQHTIEGKGLRPDAVVFLPGNTVLVIDSKASKFLLEIAELEGSDQEEEAYTNLARTMNEHLRTLANKDYKDAIKSSYRDAGKAGDIKRIMSIMYLPNEGAVERLSKADNDFTKKATKSEITVAGPTALACLIGFARVEIDLGKQAENQEQIIEKTQALLGSVGAVLGHAQSVGKGLLSASKHYQRMSKSINSNLIPKTKGLAALGVKPQKNKQIPNSLPLYQVTELETGDLIEGEVDEADNVLPLLPMDDSSDG